MSKPNNKKIIVGLGNPGLKYKKTRHNIGFMVIDALMKKVNLYQKDLIINKKFDAKIITCDLNQNPYLLVKPQTFMNNSGKAVSKIFNFYKSDLTDIFIIHDDIDLPLGRLRVKQAGSSAGHNGVQSIIDHLGSSDFIRFRLGIGPASNASRSDAGRPVPPKSDPADFVLSDFLKKESSDLDDLISLAVEAVLYAALHPIEKVKNKYNGMS